MKIMNQRMKCPLSKNKNKLERALKNKTEGERLCFCLYISRGEDKPKMQKS